MKIKKVEIEGFRAYKFKKDGTFDFTTDGEQPSNFVVIYAPNGFGKSSFYDAVEWALTDNLERYTGDHNKKNNAIAARSTKQLRVAQKIIRNKEVPDEIATQVAVSTTVNTFTRVLKKTRSDSTDLILGGAKSKKGEDVEIYKRIILSQDAIDRFLREAKPQERYELFMRFFGGEAEDLRQEMTALLSENKLQLDSLKSERENIELQLQLPVNSTIFEQFNTLAADLNLQGEYISLVGEDFSAQIEHQILSSIVTRKHSLNALHAALQQRHAALFEQLSYLPELKSNLDLMVGHRSYSARISKGVHDSVRYQALSAAHSQHLSEWQAANGELGRLDAIIDQIPVFLTDEVVRKDTATELAEVATQKARLAAELKTAESSASLFSKSLAEADKRALGLHSMISGSPAVYSEIASHEAGLVGLRSDLSSKLTSIQLDTAERDNIGSELNRISDLSITVETLVHGDTSDLGLTENFIEKVHAAHQELEALRLHDQSIKSTQVALTQQMEAVERLVAFGVSYLSKWPTNTCPLCRVPHESPDRLISAVKNNDLLSLVARQNAQELENVALRIEALSTEIDLGVSAAKNRQSERVGLLRTQFNEVSSRITAGEKAKAVLVANISATEQAIQALQLRVWGVDAKELRSRVETELKALSEHMPHLAQQLAVAEEQVANLRSKNQELDIRALGLRNLIEGIVSKETYNNVTSFASQEALTEFNQLISHCARRKNELADKLSQATEQMAKILAECNELQSVMLIEGNWIDFQLLVSKEQTASKQLNASQFSVNSFMQSVNALTDKTLEPDVEFIQREIELAVQALLDQSSALTAKIQKLDLLTEQLKSFKPYIESLLLRDRLNEVEHKLAQHGMVDERLSAEREIVVSKLRERIEAFFFTDLINSIYSKIDPHPSFKTVQFVADFQAADKPGLNIVLQDETGDIISPMLYFSAAQLNILSLSVFLANALHAKDKSGVPLDVILIDDPIQSMDSINVLATIDLLRNVSARFDKQIIISTHDENFFGLLKRKIPTEVFGSKFLQLESFGVVSQVQ